MKSDYFQLLDIVRQQSEVIRKQVQFIDRLVSDSREKENMINALMLEGGQKTSKG